MKCKLLDNLGTTDAVFCNREFGASIDMSDANNLKRGSVISLNQKAFDWLSRKYPALLEPEAMAAVAQKPSIAAVPPEQGNKPRQARTQSDE